MKKSTALLYFNVVWSSIVWTMATSSRQLPAYAHNIYGAVVVSYSPLRYARNNPSITIDMNRRAMIELIDSTVFFSDIIVFPEFGLTTTDILKSSSSSSSSQNDTDYRIKKALLGNYSMSMSKEDLDESGENEYNLLFISDVASSYRKYVVVNALERVDRINSTLDFYSTTLVFDTKGNLACKCRRKQYSTITMSEQRVPLKAASSQLAKKCQFIARFEGNLNVTFAIIFDDELFMPPPVDEKGELIRNVILTSSMVNNLPIFNSVNLQRAYSVRHRVNLLASGYSDVKNRRYGSGIYLMNGTSKIAMKSDIVMTNVAAYYQNNTLSRLEKYGFNVETSDIQHGLKINSSEFATMVRQKTRMFPYVSYDREYNASESLIFDKINNDNLNCRFHIDGTHTANWSRIYPFKPVVGQFNVSKIVNSVHRRVDTFTICGLISVTKSKAAFINTSISTLSLSLHVVNQNPLLDYQYFPSVFNHDYALSKFHYTNINDTNITMAFMDSIKNLKFFGILISSNERIIQKSSMISALNNSLSNAMKYTMFLNGSNKNTSQMTTTTTTTTTIATTIITNNSNGNHLYYKNYFVSLLLILLLVLFNFNIF